MADDFCFALLRTTTLQVLQAAGFESVQLSTADTMTEILGQYMELLANTVSNYAQLSGRTDGNALDVLDGLADLAINIEDLDDWLNVEGKDFIPTWSEQADPSRVLDGIIGTKKEGIENSFVFEYSDSDSWDDLDALISSPMSEVDSSSPSPLPTTNDLPDYVPNYLPTFPILNKEDEMDSLNDIKELQTATLPSQQQQQPNMLPHHLTVKKKKKPITNPFTHITPYEESIIATDKDIPTPMALSVLEISSLSLNGAGSPPPPSSTSEQRDLPLKRIMESFEKGKMEQPGNASLKKARLSSSVATQQSLSKIFQQATQDDASAGTRLFGRSTSMLGDIVRNLAPPLALSTLSTPNLMVDVMNIGNNESETNNVPSTPSSSAATSTLITLPTKAGLSNNNHLHNTTIDHSNPNSSGSGISLTISTKNITSAPSSPTSKSTATPIKTKSLSMNPPLNKEEDDIFSIHSLEKERKESSSRPRSSSTATNSSYAFSPPLSVPSSSSNTGAPISLASLANKTSSSTTANSSSKQSSKKQRKLTINLSNLQKKSEDNVSTTPVSSSTPTTIPANNNNNSNNKSPRFPKSLTIKSSASTPTINDHHYQHGKSKTISSSSSTPNINNNNTINGSTTSSSYNHSPSPIASPSSATAPKIRFTLKPPEPIIKAESISPSPPLSSSSTTPSMSNTSTKPINNTISIKKPSSSSSSTQSQSNQSSNSSSTSYISNNNSSKKNNSVNNNNYNLTTTTNTLTSSLSSSLPTEQVEDIIRCICENPTIDYGAFMIACDKCGIWYHGSCVGVSELDHVEEWYCQSCQTLISRDRYI
ncbi:hypothetical protein BJ944DRAFT_226608 [Cunninghamella echinulata]|nr:hypothetical protein BJ944DRAFT_226608 [Cunninghamella echinulata]